MPAMPTCRYHGKPTAWLVLRVASALIAAGVAPRGLRPTLTGTPQHADRALCGRRAAADVSADHGRSEVGVGVAAAERSALLPDVPSSREGGLPGSMHCELAWPLAPKGLPPPSLRRLRAVATLDDPLLQQGCCEIEASLPGLQDGTLAPLKPSPPSPPGRVRDVAGTHAWRRRSTARGLRRRGRERRGSWEFLHRSDAAPGKP